jgi:dihydrodipicolinate synthase/N-acetylneuraminate lyase
MPFKPGYKTTEFFVTLLAGVGATVAAAANWLPPRYAAIAAAVSAGAYAVSRGLAKMFPPPAVTPPPSG